MPDSTFTVPQQNEYGSLIALITPILQSSANRDMATLAAAIVVQKVADADKAIVEETRAYTPTQQDIDEGLDTTFLTPNLDTITLGMKADLEKELKRLELDEKTAKNTAAAAVEYLDSKNPRAKILSMRRD
jgi:hypothetical protein